MTQAMKGGSTLDLISKLDLAARGWTLMGHWTANHWVLGFARQEDLSRRVYVSSSRQRPGRYVYECEGVPACEAGEGVELDALVRVLERVLDS